VCYVVGPSSLGGVKNFSFSFLWWKGERGCVFAVFFALVSEKETLDFVAHGSIIRAFTVVNLAGFRMVGGRLDWTS